MEIATGGVTECTRMTSAYEAGFRVQARNSRPRAIRVITLGQASGARLDEFAQAEFSGVEYFVAHPETITHADGRAALLLTDFTGRSADAASVVTAADLVIIVAAAADLDTSAADIIVGACRQHTRSLMAVILSEDGTMEGEIRPMLSRLRPHMGMLVVTSEASYLETVLMSFGA